jgi:hypothetical protein
MKFQLVSLFSLLIVPVVSSSLVLPRPNWYDMSDADRFKYINTFKAVNSGPRPTIFDKIATRHPVLFTQIHGNQRFFAWHRVYLAELEQELKKIDPSVSLPYWDWTVHYNDMDQDPIWQWFGKSGNPQQENCVTEGQFVGFEAIPYYNSSITPSPHCSTRAANVPKTFTGTKEDVEKFFIDTEDLYNSSYYMEVLPHSNVHVGIGGNFTMEASANDPIFWLHHCFIDKLWNDRQQKHKDWIFVIPDGPCDLPDYNQTCIDTLDTEQYGYKYIEENFSWTITRQAKINSDIHVEIFTPLSKNGTNSDEISNKHATQYILKDILTPGNVASDKVKPGCELLNIPAAMPISHIRMMRFDEASVRQLERKSALSVDEHNRGCLI